MEVEDDVMQYSAPGVWVVCCGIQLWENDRKILLTRELTDLHIDVAQEILKM